LAGFEFEPLTYEKSNHVVNEWGSVESNYNFENLLKAMRYRMIYRNRRLKEYINMMINVIISVAYFMRFWKTLWLICLQNVAKLDMLRKGLMKCFRKNMVSWNEIYMYG
jgi:hypothetical protein